jgi:arylsulfatase A-like enzyme
VGGLAIEQSARPLIHRPRHATLPDAPSALAGGRPSKYNRAMLRRPLLVLATLVLAAPAGAADRPNVVFIMADDHAYQAIGAYGSRVNATPHIDRLAAEGMRFDRCYVTNSICGPSRACILTGKYSHKNGFYTNRDEFDGSQQTFPKLLQQAGYQTAIVGKWHLVSDPQGFDFWQILPGQGRYYSPEFLTPAGKFVVPGYVTDVITDRAIAWLDGERDTSKPFLLMVHHKAPHREWSPGPAHLAESPDRLIPEPATLFDDYANRADAARLATMRIGADLRLDEDLKMVADSAFQEFIQRLMTEDQRAAWQAFYRPLREAMATMPLEGAELVRWKYQRYMQDYLRCVQSVDDNVGRLLTYLDESGLAANTVVVYCSDQGFYLGEHGWFDKRFMYEQSLRTPLVVRWPGVAMAGAVEERIVSNLDFAETFLELAGAAPPADMQGRSLVPLLRGEPPDDWRSSFYYHYYEGPPAEHTVSEHYGVTNGRYKLIHYYKLDQWELFDLAEDPDELTSVYGQPGYASVRTRMEEALRQLRTDLGVDGAAAE